jgi:hypothetical protein
LPRATFGGPALGAGICRDERYSACAAPWLPNRATVQLQDELRR